MGAFETIGFVGVGVMGGAMSRNLARKSGHRVVAYDIRPEATEKLVDDGVAAMATLGDLIETCDLILMSLPGTPEVEDVCLGSGGVAECGRPGLVVADLSTAAVATVHKVHAGLGAAGIEFADAPVTRTAKAAVEGTLSFMVGGSKDLFTRLVPVFAHMGTDFTHCGATGCGQTVKLLNNMVCVQTVAVLADALTMGRRAGLDDKVLFDTFCDGTADSFALRNHGARSLWPGDFPTQTYSTAYAAKDLGYALELADEMGVAAEAERIVLRLLKETHRAGFADNYYPALLKVIDPDS